VRKRIDRRTASCPTFWFCAAMISRTALCAVALTAMMAGGAWAQDVNLSGRWQCVAFCVGQQGGFAFITQNGWELNMVSDAGEASRAWLNYPGRIWIDRLDQGAIYSPDGVMLQFDRGTLWKRVPEVVPPAAASRHR
jgi:hypothetical protein